MAHGHGGNLRELAAASGRPADELLDFSANINPLGPPAWLRPVISRHVETLVHYPDPSAAPLCEAAAARWGVPAACVIAGNGSTEILYAALRCLGARRAVIPVPSYIDYARAASLAGLAVHLLSMTEADKFVLDLDAVAGVCARGTVVLLGQPNNPTGQLLDRDELVALVRAHPETWFVVDEAFVDFCGEAHSLLPALPENALVLRSLTKFYAVPGLRLGLGVAAKPLAVRLREQVPPWSVNTLAQAVGVRAFAESAYAEATRAQVPALRETLARALDSLPGVRVYPGAANYLFAQLMDAPLDAPGLSRALLQEHGIAIRVCDNYEGLDERFFRVAVRPEEENARLVDALRAVLAPDRAPAARSARPRGRLMLQGVGSNAGKSVLAAAFCRILLQDGFDVAPFKAQNMALNSFVTRDGGEMGRAQVVQAQACRLAPDVRMNPILLKPSSDTGAQVIRMGKPVHAMEAADYDAYKREAFGVVRQAFDALAAEHEVIVLEGAGSPGEVNLKARDIVNMRMASYARSPVLLVGDIDRGGVYAAFVGTLEVLEEWERRLVAGFLVNRFRGDERLLASAHAYVAAYIGKPVLGVVPWLEDLGLPEEDSVSFKAGARAAERAAPGEDADARVDLALVDLPHISNFTDLDAFAVEPDARVRVVRAADELGTPDALVLPGSKNVFADIQALQARGLWEPIRALATEGRTEVVGLCGGFQMLGETVTDPEAVEFEGPPERGLGLLPVSTLMARDKTLNQAAAVHRPTGLRVSGYEIHHGRSTLAVRLEPVVVRDDGTPIGFATEDGRVWGTYLHGLFDNDAFRRWFLDRLRSAKGLEPLGRVVATYDIEPALDRLAACVREHVDLRAVYRCMGLA